MSSLPPYTPVSSKPPHDAPSPQAATRAEAIRRQRLKALGTALCVLGLCAVGLCLPNQPESIRWTLRAASGLTLLAVVFLTGRWVQAKHGVELLRTTGASASVAAAEGASREVPARRSNAGTSEAIQVYADTEEAARHGWQFFEKCGHVGTIDIPRWASLRGQWFKFEGLHLNHRQLSNDRRVFGQLSYVATENPLESTASEH